MDSADFRCAKGHASLVHPRTTLAALSARSGFRAENAMISSIPRLLLVVLSVSLALIGCRTRGGEQHHSYSYHKADVSQTQLLQDEADLRRVSGVFRVTPTHHQDGSATIEVEVDERAHIAIQQRLSDMGYTKGIH
jgi:hypothetical protein